VTGSRLTGNQRFRPGRVKFERECQTNTDNRKCGEGETLTKTSQQRSSPLPGQGRRRRSQREIAFPAAAHRAAPEAPPRKEQADQAIDLSAFDPVSRTAAARTFPIVRAVHRPGPRKTCRLRACPWRNGPSRVVAGRAALLAPAMIPAPGVFDPVSISIFCPRRPGGLMTAQFDRAEDREVPSVRVRAAPAGWYVERLLDGSGQPRWGTPAEAPSPGLPCWARRPQVDPSRGATPFALVRQACNRYKNRCRFLRSAPGAAREARYEDIGLSRVFFRSRGGMFVAYRLTSSSAIGRYRRMQSGYSISNSMRVALLENDRPHAELLDDWLSFAGHRCIRHAQTQTLVRALRHENFDVLILDTNFSDNRGIGVLKDVRCDLRSSSSSSVRAMAKTIS